VSRFQPSQTSLQEYKTTGETQNRVVAANDPSAANGGLSIASGEFEIYGVLLAIFVAAARSRDSPARCPKQRLTQDLGV
jgi:hypothetical protein